MPYYGSEDVGYFNKNCTNYIILKFHTYCNVDDNIGDDKKPN